MKNIIRNKHIFIGFFVFACIFFYVIPIKIQASSSIKLDVQVNKEKGICEYTVSGLGNWYMNTIMDVRVNRAGDTKEDYVYNERIVLDVHNCENGVFRGQIHIADIKQYENVKYYVSVLAGDEYIEADHAIEFGNSNSEYPLPSASSTPEPSKTPVPSASVKPVVSKKPVKPVEWVFTADKKTGSQVRVFEYGPSVLGGTSVDAGSEAAVYVWKKEKGSSESNAVQIGDNQVIGSEKLIWKADISKFEKGYGTYFAKLVVTKGNQKETKETTHFVIQPECTSFTTKVTSALEAKQSFGIYLKGLENPYGVKDVKFEIYDGSKKLYTSTAKPQNDSRTYYYAAVSMEDIKYKLGYFTVKAVVKDKSGNTRLVSSTTKIDRRAKKGTVKVISHSDKTMEFNLENAYIPGKIKKVSFEVYRKADGSKKSRFYSATYSSSWKTYTGKMDISTFQYKGTGTYQVNAYGYTQWKTKVLLNKSTFKVSGAAAKLTAKSPSSKNGTFVLTVSKINSRSGVSNVSVKVWRTGETKDAYAYTGVKQSNGTYKVTVDAKNHGYHFGTYHAKAYVTMGNGIKVKSASLSYTFKPDDFMYMMKTNVEGGKKVYLYNPSQKGTVTFQVYSKTDGTDDLVTYQGKKSGSGYYAVIMLNKLRHPGIVMVKAKVGNTTVRTYTFSISKSEIGKNGWVYEPYQGKTYKFYYKDGEKVTDLTDILGIKESNDSNVNNFRVEVNRAACCVTVYAYDSEKKSYCIPVKTCTVSIGRDTWTNKGASGLSEDTSYTPIGDFSISSNGTSVKYTMKPMYEPDGSVVYARWASHVVGNVYFHSIAVGADSHYALNPNHYNKLGSPASAGCIRMTVADAKWFYDYVSKGTPVKIVTGNASAPGPLGKNPAIKISSSIHYDPTDPAVPNSTKEKDYKAGRISGYMTSGGKKVGY